MTVDVACHHWRCCALALFLLLQLAAHATVLDSIVRHQYMHWAVVDVDSNISAFVDTLSLVLEVLFSPAVRPFTADVTCLHALLHHLLEVLALPYVMFTLFYSHPHALEALALACASTSASTPATLVLLDGVTRVCETPLGLLWLHHSNLLDAVSNRLCARYGSSCSCMV